MKSIYIIGSLRNPEIPKIGNALRELGHEAFDDWHAAGPEADDKWKEYETGRGHNYQQALKGYAAQHVFEFDKHHLDRCDAAVLVLPAGKSGHLELGYFIGSGKPGYILLPEKEDAKLPAGWEWLAGIFEGEGSITRNGRRNSHGMQLTVTMKDKDIITRLHEISGVGSVEGPYIRNNPNWSDMYRWSVRRREDVFFVINGIYDLLGTRRRTQISRTLAAAGFQPRHLEEAKSPLEFRFDVMYQFATKVFFNTDELIKEFS